ncbi:MAG: hypothetical protein IT465_01960 [Moraxellaceae bacterium]|nr:hypothetical protein [Moraxellaceae bacterium]
MSIPYYEPAPTTTTLKVVGANGQISLGKEFAGKQIQVETSELGVWLIRTVRVIPENELWLHQPTAAHDLQEAMNWAKQQSPRETNLAELTGDMLHGVQETAPNSSTGS